MEGTTFSAETLDPGVAKAMARPILECIRNRGAMSVPELVQRDIEVLRAPLNKREIAELLDWSRRRGLVTSLRDTTRPDGSKIEQPEWVLTEAGTGLTSRFSSWLAGLGVKARSGVSAIGSLASALGVSRLLQSLDLPTTTIVLVVLLVAYCVVLGLSLIWSSARGADDSEVADSWPRLKREHSEAAELVATRDETFKSVLRWTLLLFATLPATYIADLVGPESPWFPVLAAMALGVCFFSLYKMFMAVRQIDKAEGAVRASGR
jgi:hypothetical protein